MKTRASIKGHPIHAMLIALPIGLWVFSFIADIVGLFAKNPSWRTAAFQTMAGGVIAGIAAAVPGLIDFTGIDEPRSRNTALWHMILNLTIVALYGVNIVWRIRTGAIAGPVVLSAVAIGLLSASGWLGGALVYEHGVGVDMGESEQPVRRAAGRR